MMEGVFAGSTLLQCVDDLCLCSPACASSHEDSTPLGKLLVLNAHKVSKEKLQFAQTQVRYLAHLFSEQGPHLDPGTLDASTISHNLNLRANYKTFLDWLSTLKTEFQTSLLRLST